LDLRNLLARLATVRRAGFRSSTAPWLLLLALVVSRRILLHPLKQPREKKERLLKAFRRKKYPKL
jgi:hypothetical protein